MATCVFYRHKVNATGRCEYRQPGSTASVKFSRRAFVGGYPESIIITGDHLAPPNQHELDRIAKQHARERAAAERAARTAARAAKKRGER
jgi:hypothetical protein